MAKKEINVTVKNRCDTEYNWNISRYVPESGEIILYSDINRIKIGDGKSLAKNLSFVSTETYALSKSGSIITLIGSDGTTSSVEDSNTTYQGINGVSVIGSTIQLAASGVTAGTYGSEQEVEHGGTLEIPSIQVDSYGRVIKAEIVDVLLPIGGGDTDTKTSSKENTSTMLYIVGAPSQSATGVTTYTNSDCFISTKGELYSGGNKVLTSESPITINTGSNVTSTLLHNGTFAAITGLSTSGHSITPVFTTFTLPDNSIDDGELK